MYLRVWALISMGKASNDPSIVVLYNTSKNVIEIEGFLLYVYL